jgi:hypothetical protein
MFIAFEGPDKTGKSTSALELDGAHQPTYNITKAQHAENVAFRAGEERLDYLIPTTYDRIDWLTHMVYRLAMPQHEWNDERVRTVFTMPETHLVFKVHHPVTVDLIEDELYDGEARLAPVNEMYTWQAEYLMQMNRFQHFNLFKSISVVEVSASVTGKEFSHRLIKHENAQHGQYYYRRTLERLVLTNMDLLEFLREQDRQL